MHNSIQLGRRSILTATQTRKHHFIICTGKRGRRIEDQHQATYRIIIYSLKEDKYTERIIAGRKISARHSDNAFRNVVNLFQCLTSFFFLSEFRKSIMYFGGSIIQDMDTISQGSIYYYFRGSTSITGIVIHLFSTLTSY